MRKKVDAFVSKILRPLGSLVTLLALCATVLIAQVTVGSWDRIRLANTCMWRVGTGTPESVVVGNVCDAFWRSDGFAGATLYVKESGNGTSAGWLGHGGGGGGSGNGYTLRFSSNDTNASWQPAASTSYLVGNAVTGYVGGWTTGQWAKGKIGVPKSGSIKAVSWEIYADGVNASSQNVSLFIRLNDTTDTTLSTTSNWSTATSTVTSVNTGLSITVAAGDMVMFKVTTPAWGTLPTYVYVRGYIYIE